MRRKLINSIVVVAVIVAFSLFVAMVAGATPPTPDENIVLLDHFDGATQGTAYGSPMYAAGVLNEAIGFHTGTFVKYTLPSWYCWTGQYDATGKEGSIEMWVKPESYPSSILGFQWYDTNTPPSSGYILHLGVDTEGKLHYGHWSSISGGPPTSANPTSKSIIPLHKWTHIAATWGPDGTRLYVNGQLDAKTSYVAYPALSCPNVFVYLNYWGTSTMGDKSVDELRISSIQRSNQEIRAYYKRFVIPAKVDIMPQTIDLNAKNKVIVARIVLEGDRSAANINVDTVRLLWKIPAKGYQLKIAPDGTAILLVKFDKQLLAQVLNGKSGKVGLPVNGELNNGIPFMGKGFVTITPNSN